MNDAEIRAIVAEEVARQLSQTPRIVPNLPKVTNFQDFLKPVQHHPILSNAPERKEGSSR